MARPGAQRNAQNSTSSPTSTGTICLWRQPLDPATTQPIGGAVPLYHLHGARRSVSYVPVGFQKSSVAPDRIVFSMSERTGSVWLPAPTLLTPTLLDNRVASP